MKKIIKSIIPDFLITTWHYLNAWYGSIRYYHPSEEMLIIGVTGTSGKSSTVHFLRQMLEQIGFTVGSLSTADFYIDGEQKLNDRKMTMLGRGENHRYLRKMKEEGCEIAILETTSEGALQHRHKFINYDFVIFTTLYPEHLEAHGGFENYKACKLNILRYVSKCKTKFLCKNNDSEDIEVSDKKRVENNCKKIPKTCFLNVNNKHSPEASSIDFDRLCVFGRENEKQYLDQFKNKVNKKFISTDNNLTSTGVEFQIRGVKCETKILGRFNIQNILAALSLARQLDQDFDIKKVVENLDPPPGRLEFIPEAEAQGFKIMVDYAFEPKALRELYETIEVIEKNNIIHVCGSAGGGRDKSRRGPIGKIAAKNADIVIVTNEDPYYEDPKQIIDQVAAGVEQVDNFDEENIYKILDRGKAIEKALKLAQKDDLVLITGKGCEQGIVEKEDLKPWDDRKVVREKLKQM